MQRKRLATPQDALSTIISEGICNSCVWAPTSLYAFTPGFEMNYRIIRDQMDVEVRQFITPISCAKQESSSLSPSGHIELKKKLSDEQKGEFKVQYERVAENLQRDFQLENKGAGKILARE